MKLNQTYAVAPTEVPTEAPATTGSGLRGLIFRTVAPLARTAGGALNPAWAQQDPRGAQAAITRGQWDIFEKTFKPQEDAAVGELLADAEPYAQKAGQAVERSYAGLGGMRERMLSRYGLSATGDVKTALDRRTDLMRGLDVARAENDARDTLEERRVEGLGQMLGVMRGVSQSASQDSSAAAGMASQRDIAGQNNRARADAARDQLMSTVAGVGLAAAIAFM